MRSLNRLVSRTSISRRYREYHDEMQDMWDANFFQKILKILYEFGDDFSLGKIS